MKKRIMGATSPSGQPPPGWLRLEDLAEVEITSECPDHPIEAALVPFGVGWRARDPGEQRVRLTFDPPVVARQIRLVVEERERTRTQQFTLRVQPMPGHAWREVVRQQFNFSPSGATLEQEDYRVEPPSIAALEFAVVPDVAGGDARASLRQLRLGQ